VSESPQPTEDTATDEPVTNLPEGLPDLPDQELREMFTAAVAAELQQHTNTTDTSSGPLSPAVIEAYNAIFARLEEIGSRPTELTREAINEEVSSTPADQGAPETDGEELSAVPKDFVRDYSRRVPIVQVHGVGRDKDESYTLFQADLDAFPHDDQLFNAHVEGFTKILSRDAPQVAGLQSIVFTAQSNWLLPWLHNHAHDLSTGKLVIQHCQQRGHVTLVVAHDGQVYWFNSTNGPPPQCLKDQIAKMFTTSLKPTVRVIQVRVARQTKQECIIRASQTALQLSQGRSPQDIARFKPGDRKALYAEFEKCLRDGELTPLTAGAFGPPTGNWILKKFDVHNPTKLAELKAAKAATKEAAKAASTNAEPNKRTTRASKQKTTTEDGLLPGSTNYVDTIEGINQVVNLITTAILLGIITAWIQLDTEWVPWGRQGTENGVDAIGICLSNGAVFIFHLAAIRQQRMKQRKKKKQKTSSMDYAEDLPPTLKNLLESTETTMVGSYLSQADNPRFRNSYGCDVNSVDLHQLVAEAEGEMPDKKERGLAALYKKYANKGEMKKAKKDKCH